MTVSRWFWFGRGASAIGDTFTALAVPYLCVLWLGLGPGQTSLVLACPLGCALLAPLYAGVLADRFDRKKTFLASQAVCAVAAGCLAALAATRTTDTLALGAAAGVLAAGAAVSAAALWAGLPDIVGTERLRAANGRLQAITTAAHTAGSAAGGAALAVLGPAVAFLADGVSFLVSTGTAATVVWTTPPAATDARTSYRTMLADGARAVLRDGELRLLIGTSAVANAFIAVTTLPLLILLVRDDGFPYPAFAIILAVGSLGAFLGGLWAERITGWIGRWSQHAALGCYAVFLGSYALIPHWSVLAMSIALVVDFAIGISISVYVTTNSTRIALIVDRRLRGRTGALRRGVNSAAMLVGTACSGALVEVLGARAVISIGAVGLGAVGAAFVIKSSSSSRTATSPA